MDAPDLDALRRRWSEHEDLDAAWELADALESAGRIDEARAVCQEVLDADYLVGYLGLAWIERHLDDMEAAEALLERYFAGLAPGDADSAEALMVEGVLGHWRWHVSGRVDAEPLLRRGQAEYPSARADLASLLVATGREAEAREQLRSWVEAGDQGCCLPLGNLHQEAGEFAEAERLYLLGFERGDAFSARNLALMIDDLGREDEALEWMRRAADGGDMLAIRDLARWGEREP